MSLEKHSHTLLTLEGVACALIENNLSEERFMFIKKILEHNGLMTKHEIQNKETEITSKIYTLGVTDILFNPVLAIYAKKLKTPEGRIVTPNYWNQLSNDLHVPYWTVNYPLQKDLYQE